MEPSHSLFFTKIAILKKQALFTSQKKGVHSRPMSKHSISHTEQHHRNTGYNAIYQHIIKDLSP